MFNWFKKKDPEIGSQWLFKHGSPFDVDSVIEILAIKQGWVQYGYIKYPHWKPSSMSLSMLRFIYKEV